MKVLVLLKVKYLLMLAMGLIACSGKDRSYEFLQNAILSYNPETYIDKESPTYFKTAVTLSLLQQADSSKLISKAPIGSGVKLFSFAVYRGGECDTFLIFVRKVKNGYVISNALIKGVAQ
mgnify:CR=1 FL=1